jgi:hypothetical protein
MKMVSQTRNWNTGKFKRLLVAATIAVLLGLFAGCTKPSRYLAVKVESDPPGASVQDQLNNSLGVTPTTPKVLYRSQRGMIPLLGTLFEQELTISKEGFESAKVSLDPAEYKYSKMGEALVNVRTIKVTLKPIAVTGAGSPTSRRSEGETTSQGR